MRHRSYSALDDQETIDGDKRFIGVNTIDPPESLPSGYVTDAVNARMVDGRIRPRLGYSKLPWTSRILDGNTDPQPFANIQGGTEYEAPDGTLWMIVVADGLVYRMRQFNGAAIVTVAPGINITGLVSFAQTSMGLMMFRGASADPILMPDLDAGYVTVVQQANSLVSGSGTENPTDGTRSIAKAKRGDWFGNRLWVPFETDVEKDMVDISDYLNPTRYAPVRSQTRINQGSGDDLVRVYKFGENAAICFKSRSIYILLNTLFDLSTMQLTDITREYGLAAPDSCVTVGTDVWFLAHKRGICSITQTQQGKIQGVDVPKSREIQSYIDRINWRYAAGAQAVATENFVYFAVPIDEAKGYGGNLLTGTKTYPGSSVTVNTEIGAIYRWTKGANEVQLVNGAEVLTQTGEFTAGASVQVFSTTPNATVTCKLERVYTGVNNAVLVWSTLSQAWQSCDQQVMVRRWIKGTYDNVQRLFFLSDDGFVNLVDDAIAYDDVGYFALDTLTNLVSSAIIAGAQATLTVVPGQRYRFNSSGLAGSWQFLSNGSETLTESGEFTAQSNVVYLLANTGSPGAMDAQVYRHTWKLSLAPVAGYADLRGYSTMDGGRMRAKNLSLRLLTWYPEFRIDGIVDGVSEKWQVLPKSGVGKQFSRTAYWKPWDAPPYEVTNLNDDHATPYREDYAVVLSTHTISSGQIQPGIRYLVESSDVSSACSITYNSVSYSNHKVFTGVDGVTTFTITTGTPLVYGPDSFVELGVHGINFHLLQETFICERFPAEARGSYVRPRVEWTRGQVCVAFAGVTTLKVDRAQQTKT